MNTFKKIERLYHKKDIELVYRTGKTKSLFPIKILFRQVAFSDCSVKTVFVVPKKKQKRAVDRNLIKRRMREAYRLNKASLVEIVPSDASLQVMFIYLSNEIVDYTTIETSIKKALEYLSKDFDKR